MADIGWINKIKGKISKWRKSRNHQRFYSQFVKSGDLCFDIGANIGNRTAVFSTLGAKVIAVEPVEESCKVLQKKFEEDDNIDILPFAIGSKPGHEVIYLSNYPEVSTLSQLFIEKYSGQEKYDIRWDRSTNVRVITLDQLISDYGIPAFCKIDVEGYEPEVLTGLSQPLPCLSFEYNARLKDRALDCLEILAKFESLSYNFSPYESMKFSLDHWQDQHRFSGFVNQLPDQVETGDIYVKHD